MTGLVIVLIVGLLALAWDARAVMNGGTNK